MFNYFISGKGIQSTNSFIKEISEDLIKNVENIKKNKNKNLIINYPKFAKYAVRKAEYSRKRKINSFFILTFVCFHSNIIVVLLGLLSTFCSKI